MRDLERRSGAAVALETGDAGDLRVLAMAPGFSVPGQTTDPATIAQEFLTTNHDVFQLDADDATRFVVTGVDSDRAGGLRHVTLQRLHDGAPVFHGAITVHIDRGNGVFRVLGDDSYRIGPPSNRVVLTPQEAAQAAGKALGIAFSPVLTDSNDQHTVFTSTATLDPIDVALKVFQVGRGDDRFAYQVLLSWLDEQKEQQYDLALVDAQGGDLLARYSLVETFTGRVFNVNAQPRANATTDTRTVASFDGDATASPQGWVGTTRRTSGNNAIAATDLDANNAVGAGEIQPVASAANNFDFPYSPTQDAQNFRPAAVVNAFFLVNDFHDRTYKLGFTETSRNFQASNFGKGGAQNDAVAVDVQDGSGTNNANFATPPDGSTPRMQMFLFNIASGNSLRQDGDLDPSVIYHENTHGLSNRLVGGGSTVCLNGLQSGGMGEGWSDFVAASFLRNPIMGGYVTGDTNVGIRQFAMSNSPWTYNDVKSGNLAEPHDVGELWAATMWDLRRLVGAPVAEQLVVSGMKLTPCNPSMLNARDGIIQADAVINNGANRCKLWQAFAGRLMGSGASSPNHNSTTQIVTSSAVPAGCATGGGGSTTRNFTSSEVPRTIPDNNATGARSAINVTTAGLELTRVTVDINITHTFRGDLVIQVIAPNGQIATLSNRAGGSAQNFVAIGQDITSSFSAGSSASGQWQLFVRDLAVADIGTINSFALHLTTNTKAFAPTPIAMSFVDARTQAPVQAPVLVRLEGPARGFLRDATTGAPVPGTLTVTNGSVNLLLDGHAEASPVNPVELLPSVEASGFLKTGSTQVITASRALTLETRLISISAPPQGVTLAVNNAARIDAGTVVSEVSMATSPDPQTGSKATVTIPAGTAITDASGVALSGKLTTQLAYFSPRETQALTAFPGSLEVRVTNDPSGNRDGLFKSGGMVSVEIRDASDRLGKTFSGNGIGISIDVPAGTIDPTTNTIIPDGAQVPLWSNDSNTNEWKFEGLATANVQAPSSLLPGATPRTVVAFRAHHLSLWNLDWKLDKCPLSRTIELRRFDNGQLLSDSASSQFRYKISYPDAAGVPNSASRTLPASSAVDDGNGFSKLTFKNMPLHQFSNLMNPLKGYAVTIDVLDMRIESHGYIQSQTYNIRDNPRSFLCPRDLADPEDPADPGDPDGKGPRIFLWAGPP